MRLNPFASRRERAAAAEAAAARARTADRAHRVNADMVRHLAGALSGQNLADPRGASRVKPHNAYGGWGQLLFTDITRLRGYSRALLREYEFGGWARRTRDAIISNEARPPRFGKPVSAELADHICTAWLDWWCGADGIDGAGTDGSTMERRALWSLMEDGDAFALPWMEADMLRVETRCSGDLAEGTAHAGYSQKTRRGRVVRFGVEVDDRLRPTAYWFRSPRDRPLALPLGLASAGANAARVEARHVVHVFDPLGTDAFRGLPWLTPALIQVLQIKDADIATNSVIALMSLVAATIEHAETAVSAYQPLPSGGRGAARDDILVGGEVQPGDGDDGDRPTQVKIGDRTVLQLPPGQSLKSNLPAVETQRFRDRIMQSVSAALCMSYSRVTGDATGASYSSLRAGEVDDITHAREIHAMWVKQFRRPLFQRWLLWAMSTGRVTVPTDGATMAALRMPMWIPPRRLWVDPQKESAALRNAIEGGWMPPSIAMEREGLPPDPDLAARLDAAWLARIESKSKPLDNRPAAGGESPPKGKPTDDTESDDD